MPRLSQIVPAILTDDPKVLEAMVRKAEAFTSWVQFDIMDGKFVPSRSINQEHLAALPMKLEWEAHLMVQSPEDYLEGFQRAGAQKVVFHYEATASPQEVIVLGHDMGLDMGLAVNPETSISDILPVAATADSVLLLSVHPGYYGRDFIPGMLDKVPQLRDALPRIEIGMDGGIKEANVADIAQAGVDVIYIGSAIMAHPQPAESYRKLLSLAHEGSRRRKL